LAANRSLPKPSDADLDDIFQQRDQSHRVAWMHDAPVVASCGTPGTQAAPSHHDSGNADADPAKISGAAITSPANATTPKRFMSAPSLSRS
jgi:hypothetical protein